MVQDLQPDQGSHPYQPIRMLDERYSNRKLTSPKRGIPRASRATAVSASHHQYLGPPAIERKMGTRESQEGEGREDVQRKRGRTGYYRRIVMPWTGERIGVGGSR
jgi:hypothetical protein